MPNFVTAKGRGFKLGGRMPSWEWLWVLRFQPKCGFAPNGENRS